MLRMLAVLPMLVAPALARAAPAAPPPSCADEACVLAAGRALLEADRAAEAAEWLALQVDAFPDSGPIQLLLGSAQLRAARPLWAIDTFSRRLEQAPDDCAARTWLAWSWLHFAAVAEARAVLDEGDCAARDPWAARVLLLRAFADHSAGDDEAARVLLAQARRRDEALPEDLGALDGLLHAVAPDRLSELAWRIDAGGGYTTNPLIGSPTDSAASSSGSASPMALAEVWFRFTPDFGFWLRPTLELMPKFQFFGSTGVRDQSFVDLSGRVGLYLDWDVPRVLVAYKPSYLLLLGKPGEAPIWYYAAHRVEVEAEITDWLMIFAGAGRRDFWELGRSRAELDGGLGGSFTLTDGLFFLWTATGRGMWARDPAYDVGGATESVNLQAAFGGGFSSRVGVTVSADWYLDSLGSDTFGSPQRARTDLLVKPQATLWSPALWGFRLGASYEYSWRDSTVPAYAGEEHRVLLKLTWAGTAEATGPAASAAPTTADLDWGLGGGGDNALLDRVQDLLRQQEQVFRSCGCAE